MSKKGNILEPHTRLSHSYLWELQKNYFDDKGISAWESEVPFFISSNAYISTRYAQQVIQYILDNYNPNETRPLYIVELGAGTGKFSFYFLKALQRGLKQLNLSDFQFKYILSDVTPKNIDFCRNNEALAPLIESKQLDFALFDLEKDTEFHLMIENKPLSTLTSDYPVIFIANYVFDLSKADAFKVQAGELYEMQFALLTRYKKFDTHKPLMKEVILDHQFVRVSAENYYDSKVLNQMLHHYMEHFRDSENIFVIPVGPVSLMERFKKIAPNFLLVTGDKGIAYPESLNQIERGSLYSFDGCYAFTFNFHGLSLYFKKTGGDALLTKFRNDYKVCLFSSTQAFESLPQTVNFYQEYFETMGADEFCNLNEEFAANAYRYSLKSCFSFLKTSYYEPDTYYHMHDKLMEAMPAITGRFSRDIKEALSRVEENLYHYRTFYDVFSLLGCVYQKAKDFKKAEQMFMQALKYSKSAFLPYRHLGLLYEERGNGNKALEFYKKAHALNKKDILTNNRIAVIEGSASQLIKPLLKATFVFSVGAGFLYLLLFQ